jgi:hypothetical protein
MEFVPDAGPDAEPICPACAPAVARLRAMGARVDGSATTRPAPKPPASRSDDVIVLTEAPVGRDDVLVLTEAAQPADPAARPRPAPESAARPRGGVVFRFACPVCDVLLEASADDGGRPTTCPTCGQNFPIPQYDRRSGRVFFDPLRTPPRPKESLAFLHAYACAGRNAPTVVHGRAGDPWIQCARCRTLNPVDSNWCRSCRMPFAVENARSTSSDKASTPAKAGLITALAAVPLAATVVGLLVSVVAFTVSAGAILSLRGPGDDRKRGVFLAGCGAALSLVTFLFGVLYLNLAARW